MKESRVCGIFSGSSLHFCSKLPLSFLTRHLKQNLLSDDFDNAFLM